MWRAFAGRDERPALQARETLPAGLGGAAVRLLARLLVRLVVADHAAGRGAGEAMVTRVVAGDAADDGALDAALGRSGVDLREQRERAGRDDGQNQSHGALSRFTMRMIVPTRQPARG